MVDNRAHLLSTFWDSGRTVYMSADTSKKSQTSNSILPLNSATTNKKSRRQGPSYYKFLNEIHEFDLLNPGDEYFLSIKVQTWQKLIKIRNKMLQQQKKEGAEAEVTLEEWAKEAQMSSDELCRKVEEGLEARNKLVTANMRLVHSFIRAFIRRNPQSTNWSDLLQDGICGLTKAAEKFEVQKGFKFSTYAMYWIKSYVKRSSWNSRVMKIPLNIHEGYEKMLGVRDRLRREKDTEDVSIHDIAKEMGTTVEKLQLYSSAVSQLITPAVFEVCNVYSSEADRVEVRAREDVKQMYPSVETNEDIELEFVKKEIVSILRDQLKEEEFEYVLLRFGLEDRRPKTFQEVANIRNEKYGKVRPAIRRALAKLSKSEASDDLLRCLHDHF
eukprot:CAMPEP_0117754956 /NCGR_PEP_ID=MMETSP0947-20121206/13157_1 /TAXON_ID=44440 /ORGANISM="Chattonella subsalsa, Strain CCMP2191" /LENGTH=384 /DNA_ID=CAMNT_0005574183 /DNA_START=123 /DNA_END=1276 /DNA_ORIENTATION=-